MNNLNLYAAGTLDELADALADAAMAACLSESSARNTIDSARRWTA
jgi:hypothetical protein